MKNKDRKGKKKLKYIKYLYYTRFWATYLIQNAECLSLHHGGPLKWCFPSGPVLKNLSANAGEMQETWVWSLSGEDTLEQEMATNSSILARKIPWREEPGGLQSMGLHRVRCNWAHTHFLKTKFKTLLQSKVILEFSIKWIFVIKILYWYNFK